MGIGTDIEGSTPSLSRTAVAIRDLHPGYFAFVMATGIISSHIHPWTVMAIAGPARRGFTGFVVLSAVLVVRFVRFRPSVSADIRAPERVFGFFTIVAGIDVLGVRLGAAGHPMSTAILAALAAAVWLVLTYGVPGSLLLARQHESVLSGVNGTWLIWVVGTRPSRWQHRPWFPCGRRSPGCWHRLPSDCGASGWCCSSCS
jgi:tellurite resistance protein TehA-like permease